MTRRRVTLPRLTRAAAGAVVASAFVAAGTLAATPDATRPVGNDPRSAGEGPGLVGDPVFAIGLVIVIGIGAVVLTMAWVRLTSRNRPGA